MMIKSLSILLIAFGFTSPTLIDKLGFYKAFESNSKEKIEGKITGLSKMRPSNSKDAYIGALTMKQSQFMRTPKEKVNLFKEGRILLEKAIEKEPKNGEYRFLRFAIQENVPKILKYASNISEDIDHIVRTYKSMDPTLRKVIKEYAKQSAHLSVERLK